MRALTKGFIDLLLPPICGRCGRAGDRGSALCAACERSLPRWRDPAAPPLGIDCCVSGLAYSGEALNWIRRFKYPKRGLAGLDSTAAGILHSVVRIAACDATAPKPHLVVPVAQHVRNLRRRGFNPAAVLAREVARHFDAAFDPTALVRVRDTRSQTGLGRAARRQNVRGAFRPRDGLRLPRCVWLVDDVVTTGSTVAEAGLVLRRAGAKTVVVLCAARTPISK